jgi:hypothetical protein
LRARRTCTLRLRRLDGFVTSHSVITEQWTPACGSSIAALCLGTCGDTFLALKAANSCGGTLRARAKRPRFSFSICSFRRAISRPVVRLLGANAVKFGGRCRQRPLQRLKVFRQLPGTVAHAPMESQWPRFGVEARGARSAKSNLGRGRFKAYHSRPAMRARALLLSLLRQSSTSRYGSVAVRLVPLFQGFLGQGIRAVRHLTVERE